MRFRFCLYGFLKNQQYYEPFLLLAFLQKGLSFAEIGLLIGFREVCINLLEVPSGALADLYGRRLAMIVSLSAYVVSFAVFGLASSLPLLLPAMLFFAVGEAFRTGTHKAMIFTWLKLQGRAGEKTAFYGVTRSWAQVGSAVSVVIATALVFSAGDYSLIFFWSIPPYLIGIVNFLGYPRSLDEPSSGRAERGPGAALRLLGRVFRQAATDRPLRRLLAESMSFEGVYKAGKDYIQPIIESAALALSFGLALGGQARTALLIGAVYLCLHLMGALASRQSHRVSARWGGEWGAAHRLWLLVLVVFGALFVCLARDWRYAAIPVFLAFYLVYNLWRPIQLSRFASSSDEASGATLLSVESQVKSLATMILAPVIGFAVDWLQAVTWHLPRDNVFPFLPVAALGVILAALMFLTGRRREATPAD